MQRNVICHSISDTQAQWFVSLQFNCLTFNNNNHFKMPSPIDGYTLSWDNHANNFPINLIDLLKRNEFVDVTLVADGHLFSAHRLVLSVMSPYFRLKELMGLKMRYFVMSNNKSDRINNLFLVKKCSFIIIN